jgi:hypothetical protein
MSAYVSLDHKNWMSQKAGTVPALFSHKKTQKNKEIYKREKTDGPKWF